MKPIEAAKIIGCSVSQVRYLIHAGKLRAVKVRNPNGTYWEINAADVLLVRDRPTEQAGRGYPRGRARTKRDRDQRK